MAKLTLTANLPLNGLNARFRDTRLMAVENLDILSIALPQHAVAEHASEAHTALEERMQSAFGLTLPAVGQVSGSTAKHSLLGLQPGCWFLCTTEQTASPITALKAALNDTAYLTDQSDSWAVLDIDGAQAQAALERICPLDIADSAFDETRVARTVMEHLSVIIQRPEINRFRLYSPRSSTQSFLHVVQQSVHNVT